MSVVLEAKNIRAQRNGRDVLHIDHFVLYEGETLAIIGPNGAGKSTLLFVLGSLMQPVTGEIHFRGVLIDKRNALQYRRSIGLVLQEPLLLDTSVFDNVAAGLRFRKIKKDEIVQRVDRWLTSFGISHLRDRPARELSGGEAQRVSLARVFALNPQILFLDEPFASLDAPTVASLLLDLQQILKKTAVSTVFVTHDQNEALYLGNRVAVMLNGSIRQIGDPAEVFTLPSDREVAAFVGVETIVSGRVALSKDGRVQVGVNGVLIEAVGQVEEGQSVYVSIRPENITLYPADANLLLLRSPSSARNRLKGKIVKLVSQGPIVRVTLDCGFPLEVLITRASLDEMELSEGVEVIASFKASAVHLITR